MTESLSIRYRRPIPLDTDLTLAAGCERVADDRLHAAATIRAGGKVCLEADAAMVVAPHVTAGPARSRSD